MYEVINYNIYLRMGRVHDNNQECNKHYENHFLIAI